MASLEYIKETWTFINPPTPHPFFIDKFLVGYGTVLNNPNFVPSEQQLLEDLEQKQKEFLSLITDLEETKDKTTLLNIAFSLFLFCGKERFIKLPVYKAFKYKNNKNEWVKSFLRSTLLSQEFRTAQRLYSSEWSKLRTIEYKLLTN